MVFCFYELVLLVRKDNKELKPVCILPKFWLLDDFKRNDRIGVAGEYPRARDAVYALFLGLVAFGVMGAEHECGDRLNLYWMT